MAKNKALTKITTRAKQIRRGRPSMSWKSAIKQAGADYRAGRLGSTLMLEPKEKIGRRLKVKVYKRRRSKKGRFAGSRRIGATPVAKSRHQTADRYGPLGVQSMVNGLNGSSVSGMKSALRENAKGKLAGALLRKDMAKTKRLKRKISKQISTYRKEVKKYC